MQSPNKVYFNSDLNITALYHDYFVKYCDERNIQSVSEDKYTQIFWQLYNNGFQLPKSDTFKSCDKLRVILTNLMNPEDEKKEVLKEKQRYLRRPEGFREKFQELNAKAKETEHYFLLPGHYFLSSDRDAKKVEKYPRKQSYFSTTGQ